MNLSGLLPAIRSLSAYRAVLDALAAGHGAALKLPRAARPAVLAALANDSHRPILVLTARADHTQALAEELAAWVTESRILTFNEPNPLFYEYAAWGPRTQRTRLTVLAALAGWSTSSASPLLILASARALMTRTLPPPEFRMHTINLEAGQTIQPEKLLMACVNAGYTHETVVTEPGQFARRGGLIDIFPIAADNPVRLELLGNEIETLRHFDPATQRSTDVLASISITPAREALPVHTARLKGEAETAPALLEFYLPLLYPPASLLEYLPAETQIIVDDWQELADTLGEFETQALQLRAEQIEAGIIPPDFPQPYHSWTDLAEELSIRSAAIVWLSAPPASSPPGLAPPLLCNVGSRFHPAERYSGRIQPLFDFLRRERQRGRQAVIVSRQASRLAELWSEYANAPLTPVEAIVEAPDAGTLIFVTGALSEGWRLDCSPVGDSPKSTAAGEPATLRLLTDAEIFGWAKPQPRRRRARSATAPEVAYTDLAPGDLVVHADFGIGRFHELVRREVDGQEREYLQIEYADGDELYVPIHQTDSLTPYVGADTTPPPLSRLGTADWQTVKARTREAVEQVARELLELYARRATAGGHACGPDTPWQAELEAAFPYIETEDQLRAISEVKADLEQPRPMDRLICGDSGYGKTEVALRAAFKAVMDGRQVAMLVPTTVLAQQHLRTFLSRLAPFPVSVDMLSRFRTRAETEVILARLAAGTLDIVIGTHRLLQPDVRFKNLGLLIIDEEQRFGVTHKEHLKKMRAEVDVLTLTATPIPRTLYMSLTGVRDISTINTPPEERLPVITHVGRYDERLVRQAILRELDRGGQVFYVHNRVQTIGAGRRRLQLLAPAARVEIAHGQMEERELAQVMDRFSGGEIDILLCTSIIESGLDIPNANTIIVERADTFGLAQLHQLRGRVGRGTMRAYAYFFTDKRHRPTPEAQERLQTIAEQSELGAGYSLAMRDLEIRGAGELLGQRQHGHIAAVGFHLYTRLLAEAVRRLKAATGQTAAATSPIPATSAAAVDLPLPISIPADYVGDRTLRLRLYRRLADITTEEELTAVAAELADRFGPRPEPLENLLYQLRVKIRAARAGTQSVACENRQVVITLPPREEAAQAYAALDAVRGPATRISRNRIWLTRAVMEGDWRSVLLEVLGRMESALRGQIK